MTETLKAIVPTIGLLSVSLVAETAAKLPDPEQVNNVMSMITQLVVLVIGIWRAVKKPKK